MQDELEILDPTIAEEKKDISRTISDLSFYLLVFVAIVAGAFAIFMWATALMDYIGVI